MDPRPGRERGEFREQRERLEHEMARAIRPRRLEGEHDAAIVQEAEPVLSHRGTGQIAAASTQYPVIGHCRLGRKQGCEWNIIREEL